MQTQAPQNGGVRFGAGRPPGKTPEERQAWRDQRAQLGGDRLKRDDDDGEPSVAGRYDRAKADEMEAKAGLKLIELEQTRGALVERAAIQAAAATLVQLFTQSVRGIPDVLERREGVAADVCEKIGQAIDEALAVLANDMEAMTRIGL